MTKVLLLLGQYTSFYSATRAELINTHCVQNSELLTLIEDGTYRVIQEESAILWEMIVCVILSKKVHMNMGQILNGYRDYGKKKIRTILRARTAIT